MSTPKLIDYHKDYVTLQPSLTRESENLDLLYQSIHSTIDKQQQEFLWLSQNLLNLDVAQGYHLDFIGSIVGQSRLLSDFNAETYFGFKDSYKGDTFGSRTDPSIGGYWNSRSNFDSASARKLNDEEYRRVIRARTIYNQSNCISNDILEVLNLLSNTKDNYIEQVNQGLIKIRTSDTSGIVSYFISRIDTKDNILPIAAGVRASLTSS